MTEQICQMCNKPVLVVGKSGLVPKNHPGACYKRAKRQRWEANQLQRLK